MKYKEDLSKAPPKESGTFLVIMMSMTMTMMMIMTMMMKMITKMMIMMLCEMMIGNLISRFEIHLFDLQL